MCYEKEFYICTPFDSSGNSSLKKVLETGVKTGVVMRGEGVGEPVSSNVVGVKKKF